MNMTLSGLIQAAVDTIRDPRAGARMIIGLPMERRQRWELLLLIVVISAVMAQGSLLLSGASAQGDADNFLPSPFTLGVIQFALLGAMSIGIYVIGRKFGGKGSLDDSILLVVWLQFVMICLQVVQTIALLIVPILAMLIGFAGFILFFWMLSRFISELHGFKSTGLILVITFVSMVAFVVVLSVLLSMLGIYVPGTLPNV